MACPDKHEVLRQWFRKPGKVAVAFSGGVDSSFLLAVAAKELHENVIAFTVKTPYIPEWEIAEAQDFCKEHGIRHHLVNAGIIPEIKHNPVNRCYLCKQYIFTVLQQKAGQLGFEQLLDGSNADDAVTYRPGLAALREIGIKSPLLELGITKAEVRIFSEELGLKTARKPSYACLLTRLPYNTNVMTTELRQVENAERYLASKGYANSRVRHHGSVARIELEKNSIAEFMASGETANLTEYFHALGYEFITIDLEGYRSGSFDKKTN